MCFRCDREVDQVPVPMPAAIIGELAVQCRDAFIAADVTGTDGNAIIRYFIQLDENAQFAMAEDFVNSSERPEGHDLVVFPRGHSVGLIFGNFGDAMDPEFSPIVMLSMNSYKTWDTSSNEWVTIYDEDEFTEDHLGIWASPALEVPQ
jgi:hypothetical protein